MRVSLSIGFVLILRAAAFSQEPASTIWHENFSPVQQKITAEAHNQGLEGALRFLSVYRISFYVDKSVMRRQSDAASLIKFVFHFSDRPMWQIMDYVAADVGGIWQVENGICVLRANPVQTSIEFSAPAKADAVFVPAGGTMQSKLASAPLDTAIVRNQSSTNTLDQQAADYMRMNLTNNQRAIMRSRGYLKSSELSRAQKVILAEWLQTIRPGRIRAVQSKGVYSQIKRIN